MKSLISESLNGSGHFVDNKSSNWSAEELDGIIGPFLYGYYHTSNIVVIALYLPVILIAAISNVLVILVIYRFQHLRSVTNYFLVSLSIADLLVTLICMPIAIATTAFYTWHYGLFMCKFTPFLQGVAASSSVFSILAMSMDRYLAIRHPMVFRQVFNKRVARCVIIVIWLVASLLFIPCFYVRTTEQLKLPENFTLLHRTFCYENWSNLWIRRVYNVVLFISIYAAPCLMILTAYISMGCKLCSPSVINNREGGDIILDRDSRLLRSRRRVARTLLVLAIVFTFCWMPYNLLLLGEDENFFSDKGLVRKVMPFTLLLAHINSAANPLLYCFFSRNLRQCLWNLLRARRQNRRPSSEPLPPSDPRCRLSRIQSPACNSHNRAARAVHRRVSVDLEKGSGATPSSSKKHENESTPTTTLLPLQTTSSITPVPVHHHSSDTAV